MIGDGDGWVTCARGHRHWGRYGAAGLLIRTEGAVVLQHRAPWSHHGGTWGVPGGARDSHETVAAAALREAAEEAGIDADSVRITGVHTDDHGGWSYATVLAEPSRQVVTPASTSAESVEVGWQPVETVDQLPLHPGFALTWATLRAAYPPPELVVDAANVVGSRPDGWWHQRLSAAQRLHGQLAVFAESGLEPGSWPQPIRVVGLSWLYPRTTMVVEGEASRLSVPQSPSLRVVAADGSGDDAIVDVVREHPHAVVVTADRELRQRVGALGADVIGPRWFLNLITD
ncbi:MAG: NUDIX domain-containing protein [Geodermatophilaceae bacterium]